MVQLFATRCNCTAILWVSLVSFAAIILRVVFQRVFIVLDYFVIDSVRKILDTPSYSNLFTHCQRHEKSWLICWVYPLQKTNCKLIINIETAASNFLTPSRLRARWSRVRVQVGAGIFLFTTSRPALEPTHPPIHWVPGSLSLEIKRPGR